MPKAAPATSIAGLVASFALVLGGCGTSTGSQSYAVSVDDTSVLSALAGFRDSPAFVKVNDAPYATGLGTGALVNVYVSAQAFAPYASITPEKTGSGAEVPEGTMIVREVLEPSGAVKTLTLMVKGPKGYNPDLGDYWFGVTDANAVPVLDTQGAKKLGRVEECYSCHTPRASDDWLFGVPAANRPGVGPGDPPDAGVPPPPPPPPSQEPLCGDFACNLGESCLTCPYDCGVCPPEGGDDHGGSGGGGDNSGPGGGGGSGGSGHG
jgi:hypothetical protein